LGSASGFGFETSTHTLRMILSGLFDKYPKLNIILGHLGEGLPFTLPRVEHRLRHQRRETHGKHKRPPMDYLRNNFYLTTSGTFRTQAFLNTILEVGTESALRQSLLCLDVTGSTRNQVPQHARFHKSLQLSVSSEVRPGNSLATERSSPSRCGYYCDPRGDAMNSIDLDVPIKNVDELAPRRDDPLVAAVQAGVPEAFAQLHAIYSARLYKTITAITKNPEDARDALQETFLRAHLSIHAFEGRSSISTWLSRIAINSALMILRKRRARPEGSFDPQPHDRCETIFFDAKDPGPNPEEAYVLYERQINTLKAIRRLNPKLQEPIRMQMDHGWSVREICQALNISEPATKSRIIRARRQLSITLADQKCFAARHRQSFSVSPGRDSVLPACNHGKR
jgi:RNA polymerase sigma factor (sigma-70 family)